MLSEEEIAAQKDYARAVWEQIPIEDRLAALEKLRSVLNNKVWLKDRIKELGKMNDSQLIKWRIKTFGGKA